MRKKNLYIIGASSFARELECWLEMIPEDKKDFNLLGFFDKEKPANFISDYPYLGDEDEYDFKENDYCLIAIASPKVRERLFRKLEERVKFYTFIAHNVIVAKFTSIGEGSIISPSCILSTNVHIDACVVINSGTQIGHDCKIGAFTAIMANVDIAGNCKVGSNVFIGSNAVVIPSKTLGDECMVGAGSVVIKSVKPMESVFGNPARRIN